jgi:hypothetical protein
MSRSSWRPLSGSISTDSCIFRNAQGPAHFVRRASLYTGPRARGRLRTGLGSEFSMSTRSCETFFLCGDFLRSPLHIRSHGAAGQGIRHGQRGGQRFLYSLGRSSAFNIGYRIRHLSNGGIRTPNTGINSHILVIGVLDVPGCAGREREERMTISKELLEILACPPVQGISGSTRRETG